MAGLEGGSNEDIQDVGANAVGRGALLKAMTLLTIAGAIPSCDERQPHNDFVAGSRSELPVNSNQVVAPVSVTASALEEMDREDEPSTFLKALSNAGDRMLFPPTLGGMPDNLGINGLTPEQRVILESERSRAKFFNAIEK